MYPFELHLFSFFDAHDSQIWPFDGVADIFHIPFATFQSFGEEFCCFFNMYLFFFEV
jgi:hypothetical protein